MNYWIITSNEEKFRLGDLLKECNIVDWRQNNSFEINDIVYIYSTKPFQRIRFKMQVIGVNIPSKEYINDSKFWVDKESQKEGLLHNRFIRLRLIEVEPESGGPSLAYLRGIGITNFRGVIKLHDINIIKKIQNLMNPTSTERIVRICWNTNKWEFPSGLEGKLESGFESDWGFGHEEWLLDRSRICLDGYHYGYIRGFTNNTFECNLTLHLYSKTPDKRKLYIGIIKKAEYVSPEKSEEIIREYKDMGWEKEMRDEIYNVTGEKYNEFLAFNVRFQFKDFVDYTEKQLYLSKDDPNTKWERYCTPYKVKDPFVFEVGKPRISFKDLDSNELLDPNNEVIEGAKILITVNRYERNSEARRLCIKVHGCKCAVCGFDFEKMYGAIGKGFIHVHHLKPIAEIGREYKLNPEKELVPVCPNCHAMLHRGKAGKVLSVSELQQIIERTNKQD